MRYKLPFALLLAACATNSPTDDSATVATNLEQPNGGETTADEAPMFADETAFDAMGIEADATFTDSMASDPAVTSIANTAGVASHRLLLLWGHMPVDPNATARDWSGSLTISRGALVVSRTIAFEDATDKVLPRTSPAEVDFTSRTRPAADGLALRVLDPTPNAADPLTLTYQGSATYTLDLAQLATGPIVIDAGDGNKIVALAVRDLDCAHGFMRGRFHQLLPHVGVYRGVVVDAIGAPVGHVRGIYGEKRDGSKVLFGKFIDLEGHFRGVLAGTYGDNDFSAKWIDKAGDHGFVKGAYFDSPLVKGGVFAARWAETSCAQ